MPPSRVAAAAGGVFCLALAWRILPFYGFSNDDYLHLSLAQQMLLGELPVRDFVDPGMPLTYLTSAAAQWLGGSGIGTELLVDATALALGAALTVVAVTDLAESIAVAVLVALLEVLIFPRTYSYPKVLMSAAVIVAMVAVARTPSRGRLIALGGLVSVTFLFRHDHGVYLGAAVVMLGFLLSLGDGRLAGQRIGAIVVGTLPPMVPWICYVQWHQGIAPYLRAGVEFARAKVQEGNLVQADFQWPLQADLAALYSAQNSEAWLFYLFVALPLIAVVGALWMTREGRERWSGEAVAVASIAVMALIVDTGLLRENLKVKLPDVAVPAAVLGGWITVRAWSLSGWWSRSVRFGSRTTVLLVLLITAAATFNVGDTLEQLDRAEAFGGLRGIRGRIRELRDQLSREHARSQMPSTMAASLMPYFSYFARCTSPDDRLLITSFNPEMHILVKRGFAGGHPPLNPVYYTSDADQTLTVARLRRESVPLVLAPVETYDEFRRTFPIVQSYLSERYLPVADAGDPFLVHVFADRFRPVTGVDSEFGWPCFHRR